MRIPVSPSRDAIPEIVATLGPASWDLAPSLREAGATIFRINTSHMATAEIGRRVDTVRLRVPGIPVVLDLQGAKMRLGCFDPFEVKIHEQVRFSLYDGEDACPIPHREIFEAVSVADTLSCDDDRIRLRVTSRGEGRFSATALSGGILRPRKGVNLVEHPVVMSDLSDFDIECLRTAATGGLSAVAYSFMRDGHEAEWVRRRAPDCRVIGKIERHEAAENIEAIATRVDAVWICRGDLGAQLGPASMARWISGCAPRSLPCPVFMAGQVLEHLTRNPEPTRSEVCHLLDLFMRGYAGFILSDETAIGIDPLRSVGTLRSLLDAFRRD